MSIGRKFTVLRRYNLVSVSGEKKGRVGGPGGKDGLHSNAFQTPIKLAGRDFEGGSVNRHSGLKATFLA